MKISVLGGSARHLGDCTPWMGWDLLPAADGFILSKAQESGVGLILVQGPSESETWLTRPDNAADLFPRVSPDGTRIAFARASAGGLPDLYVLDLASGQERRLTSEQAALAGFSWTANSDALIAARGPIGGYQLWHIPVEGGRAQLISVAGTYDPGAPSREVNGRFAYADWRFDYDIRVLTRSGLTRADEWVQSLASTRWDYRPQVSPDGSMLAFISNRSGPPELWLARRGVSGPVRISDLGAVAMGTPAWDPEGRWLVTSVLTPEGAEIVRFDVDGRPEQLLVDEPGLRLAPSVSRDGQRVYFGRLTADGWRIEHIPTQGGRAERVDGAHGAAAHEGPEGAWLYFTRRDDTGLWRVPTGGGESSLVVSETSQVPSRQPFLNGRGQQKRSLPINLDEAHCHPVCDDVQFTNQTDAQSDRLLGGIYPHHSMQAAENRVSRWNLPPPFHVGLLPRLLRAP